MNQRQRDDLYWELFGNTSAFRVLLTRLRRHAIALGLVCTLFITTYAIGIYVGWRAESPTTGVVAVPLLRARVVVDRDVRGIPHVSASSEHDLFFAQGFVEGSDRLFEMDLTRRYALGELAEVLGRRALPMDEMQRYYDVRDIANRQWRQLAPRERDDLEAFSDGVNASIGAQPLPIEFRILTYRPKPWTPTDSIAVSLAVSIALADSWRDVLSRNDIWRRVGAQQFAQYVPLSDPPYDVTLEGAPAARRRVPLVAFERMIHPHVSNDAPRAGSNAWAAGAARTVTHRALIANDPHLDLTIPGLWYLLDLKGPGFHAAGASIPGVPGVLLGHNSHIAWAATNSDATSMTLFYAGPLMRSDWKREVFHVRFGKDVSVSYFRDAREFGVPYWNAQQPVLVRWPTYYREQSAIKTFLDLDRAQNTRQALCVLSRYAGTSENFVIADNRGAVAYHLAGGIVDDAAWGRYVHPARDISATYPPIPFEELPAVPPSRNAVIISANNKMYGDSYPYRLASSFDAPYRAYRIAQLLRAKTGYDVSYFARMQLDTVSPIDLEFARAIAQYSNEHLADSPRRAPGSLAAWDGSFSRGSRTASIEHAIRASIAGSAPSLYAVMQLLRSGATSGDLDQALRGALFSTNDAVHPWGLTGAVSVDHPLAPLPFGFLNGATLPGDGDEYTIHLQEEGFAQSFRAVWDVGNWDAGGISIPSGESGEPGSGHYTDLTAAWIAGTLEPLPFSDRAIARATRDRLTLVPQ